MSTILQNLAVVLDEIFILVGSNATYATAFLAFCNLLDRSYSKAVDECGRLQPPEKDAAARKVERKSAIYSGMVLVLMAGLGIGLTVYNISRAGIIGGVITAILCFVNFLLYFFD